MFRLGFIACGVAFLAVGGGSATAQYYPPPGYPPPGYPSPDYSPYPPPRYAPPYDPPRRALGFRCDAWLPTAYGARALVCDIARPRPLGRPCVCPPPPPPPGYSPAPYLNGRVIP